MLASPLKKSARYIRRDHRDDCHDGGHQRRPRNDHGRYGECQNRKADLFRGRETSKVITSERKFQLFHHDPDTYTDEEEGSS